MDYRTKDEFEKDIKVGTKIEREIIDMFAILWEDKVGYLPTVIDNGCGNDGEYLEDGNVSTDADFIFDGKPFEVKFIRPNVDHYHMKHSQVKSYVRQGAYLLQVMGWNTPNPTFTVFSPTQLKAILKEKSQLYVNQFGGKLGYRIYKEEMNWQPLKISKTKVLQ
jgi:hypothetical protein